MVLLGIPIITYENKVRQMILRNLIFGFLAHLVINQRALYNHELSIGIGIVIIITGIVVICAHLPLAQG